MELFNIKIWILIIGVGASAVACSPGKTSAVGARGAIGAAGTATVSGGSCKTHSGRIYSSENSQTGTFEQRVKGLVSATVNPAYFGAIDGSASGGNTCVAIEGHLSYDSTGVVNLSQSNLKIIIYDSLVGTKDSNNESIEPYVIQFASASTGTVNLNGKSFSLQFKDEYGEINLAGSFNTTQAAGTVSYQNYTSFDNGTPASGALGDFSLSAPSFIY